MTYVLAAIDDSAATRSVLAATRALATLLRTQGRALHVREGGTARLPAQVREGGMPLRVVDGDPVTAIREAFNAADVVAGVIGACGAGSGLRPAGHTALAVIQALGTPVLVVPPSWMPRDERHPVRRVLVPLDASHGSSEAVRRTVDTLRGSGVEIVVLHVFDPDHVPAFSDQPQHELPAWGDEFLTRYAQDDVRLELRRGHAGHNVVDCCREQDADVVVLGWSQDLSPGRAAVVREVLSSRAVPVLLLPVVEPPANAGQTVDSPRLDDLDGDIGASHLGRRTSR